MTNEMLQAEEIEDMTDEELEIMESEITEEEEKMIEKIKNLPYFVLNLHPNQVRASQMEYEDLAQEMRIECIRAVRAYIANTDPGKGRVTTVAVKYMEQRLLRLSRLGMKVTRRSELNTVSMNQKETINAIEKKACASLNNSMYRYTEAGMETAVLVEQTRAGLDEQDAQLFDALLDGQTAVEIAAVRGVAPQTVSYHIHKLRERLSAFHEALTNG